MNDLKKHILNENLKLSTILNILKSCFKNEENIKWLKNELEGYKESSEVPSYRIIETEPIFEVQKGNTIQTGVKDEWERLLAPFKDKIFGDYDEVLDAQKNYRIINSVIEIEQFKEESYIELPINIVRAKTTNMQKEPEASHYGIYYGAIKGKYSITKSQVDVVKNEIKNKILNCFEKETEEVKNECINLIDSILNEDKIKKPIDSQNNQNSMVINAPSTIKDNNISIYSNDLVLEKLDEILKKINIIVK